MDHPRDLCSSERKEILCICVNKLLQSNIKNDPFIPMTHPHSPPTPLCTHHIVHLEPPTSHPLLLTPYPLHCRQRHRMRPQLALVLVKLSLALVLVQLSLALVLVQLYLALVHVRIIRRPCPSSQTVRRSLCRTKTTNTIATTTATTTTAIATTTTTTTTITITTPTGGTPSYVCL